MPGLSLYCVYFTDPLHGWIGGKNMGSNMSIIMKTTDGGKTWSLPQDFAPRGWFYGMHFVDNQTGWAVGSGPLPTTPGSIVRSLDGGRTWSGMVPAGVTLVDIHFVGARRGWTVGYETLMRYAPFSE